MSAEQWTFVGVVIGAILAGGLALIREVVVAREARKDRLLADRREAYLTAMQTLLSYKRSLDRVLNNSTNSDRTLEAAIAENQQTQELRLDVSESLTHLILVAPEDTAEAAERYASATTEAFSAWRRAYRDQGEWLVSEYIDMMEKISNPVDQARADFIRCAKRDLGVR